MRVIDRWREGGKATLSFELFPARTDKAAGKLPGIIDKLAALGPDFVSVTFGAGGSTRDGSRDLVAHLGGEKGLEVMAYFACYGLGPDDIVAVLDAYQELGVENVLAVRGDPPHDLEGFEPHPAALAHASDLVSFIRERYSFCLGVAGYPEGHIEADSLDQDLIQLRRKVEAGAAYIITNYCYDNAFYFEFVRRCRAEGIAVPILPGVMPIYSVKMMESLAKLCGATITGPLRRGLAAFPEGDRDALFDFSVDFAVEQCRGLLAGGAPGLHIYTMDRARVAAAIVERLRAEGLL